MKKTRAFKRDAYLGIRMPTEDKQRLIEAARKKRRDTSSIALECIVQGLRRIENELAQPQPQ